MRQAVNDLCNVVTGEHSQAPGGAPQITVPHLRLRLHVGEAEALIAALQAAVDAAKAAKAREWTEIAGEDLPGSRGRLLYVEDGQLGHYTALAEGEGVAGAIADYVAGYESPGGTVVKVWWHLYEDGAELDSGRWTFTVGA